jgi:hypothetical protein
MAPRTNRGSSKLESNYIQRGSGTSTGRQAVKIKRGSVVRGVVFVAFMFALALLVAYVVVNFIP